MSENLVAPHSIELIPPRARATWLRRAIESDVFYSFRRSRLTMIAAAVTALFFLIAIWRRCLPYRTRSIRRNCN